MEHLDTSGIETKMSNMQKLQSFDLGSLRKTEILVGALFLIATAAYIAGSGLLEFVLRSADRLVDAHLYTTRVVSGALLELLDAAAVVGIGILLFPILKKQNGFVARAYLGTRIVEAMLLVLSIAASLLLIIESKIFASVSPATLVAGHYGAFALATVVLGLGSLPFCYTLYTARLIPQSLSVLGFIGYAALLAWGGLQIFGYSAGMILFLPGGLFEVIFPVWLIVKGFNPSAISFQSEKTSN